MDSPVLIQTGSTAADSSSLVAALLIFMLAGIAMVLGALLVGRLLRTRLHHPEKDAIYECGEPTIGRSWIQFDLRFYVVALVFIIFDVEIALFYPWAVVFGGGTLRGGTDEGSAAALRQVQFAALWDMLFFFSVLVVGFLYLWRYGYLDWVRACTGRRVEPRSSATESLSVRAEPGGIAV
jgi:NADH-quinone oxidoreductase subunit A